MRVLLYLLVIALLVASLSFEGYFVQPLEATRPEEVLLISLVLTLTAAIALLVAAYLSKTVSKSPGQRFALVAIWLIVSFQVTIAVGNLLTLTDNMQTAREILYMNDSEVVEIGSGHLLINGLIGLNTLETFKEKNLSNVGLLELDSVGGLIDPAIEIGKLVERYQITTFVEGECSSACVLIAIKGKFLFASSDSQFGFHQGSSVSDRESSQNRFVSQQATDILIQELKAGGIPDRILRTARNTPSDQMTVYTGSELQNAGVVDRLVDFR